MATSWTEKEVKWTIKDVGAPLLDSIATSLYSKLEVFREYAQNAIDSYADFQRLTGRQPQNAVQVWVDADNAALHVMDYGVGMDEADINTSKSIAVSPKLARANDFVGFRGLGIWSGLSVCRELVLTTTKVNVPFMYRLTIDCKDIVEHIEDPIPIDDLLQGRFHIREAPADLNDHFTQVKLIDIDRRRFGELLDVGKIIRYAEDHLPVPFQPEWGYADKVQDALRGVPWTTNYELTVNEDPVYRRFPTTNDIKEPERHVIVDSGGKEIAVAWLCETNRRGSKKAIEVGSEGPVRNFAVRVKDFTVGRRGLYAEQGVADPGNLDWYVGEIYITDTDIRPDTTRTKFQPSARHDVVIAALRRFYTSTALRARGWSTQVATQDMCIAAQAECEKVEAILDDQTKLLEDKKKDLEPAIIIVEEYKKTLESQLSEANRVDGAQEAERTIIMRRYIRKPEVKRDIDTTLSRIAAVQRRLTAESPDIGTLLMNTAKTPTNSRTKRSKARTERLRGTSVKANDVFGARVVAGILPGLEQTFGRDNSEGQHLASNGLDNQQAIAVSTAIEAFDAAVAAVVGDRSETYRRIMDRVADELRRRGAHV